ncbi:Type II secretory pathway, component PulK [Delftia tsuruhatensis]|uniref:type II secretion system minor pseudopilin GspK n=1 Tax=Delftia tsuruhatensis TaxID=180282 RepID=UPI001E76A881|nr:type II secretion system minor pseudopilin GspK [Delftia tsuruhatensis]CAB5662661.1 Type II secretory pathway, component PulK [Delftia tsuruhatensis]CAC9677236.1 Type II secretory pathway, component PulK [Delftia tsuruhatensis]
MTRATPCFRQPHQRGAALLAAMLTVTLVATFAATALWQQWRSVEVETAERNRMQAAWILLGALDWSRVVLAEDARTSLQVDHLAEPWAVPLQEARLSTFLAAQNNVSQVDDGMADMQDAFLSGQIIDLQSRLNLRNLLTAPDKPESLRPLARLLERLNLPPAYATQIVQALRAASSASEGSQFLMPRTLAQLGWLGLPPEVIARLEPYITLLPENTPVNLNTASAEVIWASVEDLTWSQASQLVQLRASRPLRSLADASNALGLPQKFEGQNLSVATTFFEARGRMRLGDVVASERSMLRRSNMLVTTIWRERGDWGMPGTPAQ